MTETTLGPGPYQVPGSDQAQPVVATTDKTLRPDGSRETPMPPMDEINKFIAAHGGAVEPELSAKADAALGSKNAAIISKVIAFLNPKLRGPLGFATVRHKFFIFRLPVQAEVIDVLSFVDAKLADDFSDDLSTAKFYRTVMGELKKACYGFVPVRHPDFALLRANIDDPEKWPKLHPIEWEASRDPYQMNDEILPLWEIYITWKKSVTPTREEIDFYWASQV